MGGKGKKKQKAEWREKKKEPTALEKKKDIEEPPAPERKKEVAPSESGTGNNIPSADLQSSAAILQQLPPALNNLTPATPPQKPSAELKSSSSDEPSEQIVTFMALPKKTGTQNGQSTVGVATGPLTTNSLPDKKSEEIFGDIENPEVDALEEKGRIEAEVELVESFLTEYKTQNSGSKWKDRSTQNTTLLEIIAYGKSGKAGYIYSSGDSTKATFNSVFGINLKTDERTAGEICVSIIDAHIAAKTAAASAQKPPAPQ